MSFGDPRHEWNDHDVEHYAPTLAACASEARLQDKPVGCRLIIDPSLELTVPFYPDVTLTEVLPEVHLDPAVER